ncbi:MAG: VacB/RNase II family 3'-5' exoribonuclease [Deltaproteobacteria bacterium]|nr:VacB/RNase II family 3'-5' exoribonuclease [Deltaproteobacteria bacterium]
MPRHHKPTPAGPLRDRLLGLLDRHPGEEFSLKELRDRLDVGPDDRREMRELLGELEEEGRVQRVAGRCYRAARPVVRVEGRVHRHERGFGWLLDTGAPDGNDPFIPPDQMEGLLQGDRVRARLEPGRAGKPRAVIEKVLTERARTIGTLRRWGKRWVVEVDAHADGFLVEGTGEAELRDGAAAMVTVTTRPEATHRGTVDVERVLGESGTLAVEVEKLVLLGQVPVDFPADALAEVAALSADPVADAAHEHRRRDLTALPLVTIDGEDARDFDDAVHVAREGKHLVLTVAIADVAHYVREGTALDRSAAERGTSIYFPGRVIPMLPHRLSDDLCSLRPNVPRLCLAAKMTFEPGQAVPGHVELFAGLMKSRARLTYTRVHEAAAAGLTSLPEAPGFDLAAALELFRRLRAARLARGALDLDLPEPRFFLDPSGDVRAMQPAPRWESHQLIEEFMIAANEAVARHFEGHQWPCVYRVHEPPDEEKLKRFLALASAHVKLPKIPPSPAPSHVAAILELLRGHRRGTVLQGQLLRAMMQARYDAANLGHYGLASEAYLHFTSPIRRYPDLLVHRELHRHLTGGKTPADREARLETLAGSSSRTERRATDLERQCDALYAASACTHLVGRDLSGTVTGVADAGLFVRLDDNGADGLIPLDTLAPGRILVDDEHAEIHTAAGARWGLGDPVKVRVASVNLGRRQVTLALAGARPAPGGFARERPPERRAERARGRRRR